MGDKLTTMSSKNDDIWNYFITLYNSNSNFLCLNLLFILFVYSPFDNLNLEVKVIVEIFYDGKSESNRTHVDFYKII